MEYFDLSKIQMSKNDIKKGLKLPEKMTNWLAEDIGIMIGDGSITVCKRKHTVNYEISCASNLQDERDYYLNKGLKYNLFDINFKFRERPCISVCELRTYSRGPFEFYNKIIGLPLGKKNKIGYLDPFSQKNLF